MGAAVAARAYGLGPKKGNYAMRALLAVNAPPIARQLSAVLSAEAVVDQTGNGEEALKQLARHCDYDIIILDMLLPDIEGCEVLRRLRSTGIRNPSDHAIIPLATIGQDHGLRARSG